VSRVLIVKTGAAGDVVRTTPIMTLLAGDDVDWFTSPRCAPLLAATGARVLTQAAELRRNHVYDLVISLEEAPRLLSCVFAAIRQRQIIGAYPAQDGTVRYTSELSAWFDMSLISRHGRAQADRLKRANRRAYQEMIFAGLGATFAGEEYILPEPRPSRLKGSVALIDHVGARWPNKRWAGMRALEDALASVGNVNILPLRRSLLSHLGDIVNHDVVVTPDSLPLHVALGAGKAAIGIFNCTSPWEIHPYGRMTALVSPRLDQFFYTTEPSVEATAAIDVESVHAAVLSALVKTIEHRHDGGEWRDPGPQGLALTRWPERHPKASRQPISQ
jgi:heptosyltransferase-2